MAMRSDSPWGVSALETMRSPSPQLPMPTLRGSLSCQDTRGACEVPTLTCRCGHPAHVAVALLAVSLPAFEEEICDLGRRALMAPETSAGSGRGRHSMALRLKDGRGQAQMDVPHCAVWTAGLDRAFCAAWHSHGLPWAVSLGAHPYLAAEQQQQESEERWLGHASTRPQAAWGVGSWLPTGPRQLLCPGGEGPGTRATLHERMSHRDVQWDSSWGTAGDVL